MSDERLWDELVHPDDVAEVTRHFDRHGRLGEPLQVSYRITHRDGRIVWVEEHASIIGTSPDGHRLSQGVIVDITERRALEDQLRAGAEHGGGGPARRRRRPRLQQPADRRSWATRRSSSPSLPERRPPPRGRRRRSRSAAERRDRAHPAAAGVQPQAVLQPEVLDLNDVVARRASRCSGGSSGSDIELQTACGPEPPAGARGPGPDRAGRAQPRGQRPRRDARAADA